MTETRKVGFYSVFVIISFFCLFVPFQTEDKIECIESKKVKYHCREDLAWSLSIPMEEIVNKGNFKQKKIYQRKTK